MRSSLPGQQASYAEGWEPNVMRLSSYTLQWGEDPYRVAQRLGVDYATLAYANRGVLRNQYAVPIGTELTIPEPGSVPTEAAKAFAAKLDQQHQAKLALAQQQREEARQAAQIAPGSSMAFRDYVDPACVAPPGVNVARPWRLPPNIRVDEITVPDVPDRPNYFWNAAQASIRNIQNAPAQHRGAAAVFGAIPTGILLAGAAVEEFVNFGLGINDRVNRGMQNFGMYSGSGDSSNLLSGALDVGWAGAEVGGAVAGAAWGLGTVANRIPATGMDPFPRRSFSLFYHQDEAKIALDYDLIRASTDDVSRISANYPHIPEQMLHEVKQHVFFNEHLMPDASGDLVKGMFAPQKNIAEYWMRAANGTLEDMHRVGEGVPGFERFVAHEYVESGLEKLGIPYRKVVGNGVPPRNMAGAHDLAPHPDATQAPWFTWKNIWDIPF